MTQKWEKTIVFFFFEDVGFIEDTRFGRTLKLTQAKNYLKIMGGNLE